jgi:hypothetical protein
MMLPAYRLFAQPMSQSSQKQWKTKRYAKALCIEYVIVCLLLYAVSAMFMSVPIISIATESNTYVVGSVVRMTQDNWIQSEIYSYDRDSEQKIIPLVFKQRRAVHLCGVEIAVAERFRTTGQVQITGYIPSGTFATSGIQLALGVPQWGLLALGLMATTALRLMAVARRRFAHMRDRQRLAQGKCPRCLYPFTPDAALCVECGRVLATHST